MVRSAFILLLLGLFLPGCGSSTTSTGLVDMGGEDGTKVAFLIEDMNDVKGSGKKFGSSFAKGSAPSAADAKKFTPYVFYIVGKPKVVGGDATAKVSIKKEIDNSDVAEKEWTFVKEGDAWKIKAAPLP